MKELSGLFDALPPGTLVVLGLSSLAVFVGTLLAIPFVLVRLPADYFDVRVQRTAMKNHHPVLRFAGHLAKNIFGMLFLLAGLAMLILPGQGVLTILIGISMLDFPGKQRLQATIVGQRHIFGAINSLRTRSGKPPFTLADPD